MTKETRKLVRELERLGCTLVPTSGSNHLSVYYEGKKVSTIGQSIRGPGLIRIIKSELRGKGIVP